MKAIFSIASSTLNKGVLQWSRYFSEINIKLAERNEFITHFSQECLETREKEQKVVLNESSEAFGKHSEIVRKINTCHDNSC